MRFHGEISTQDAAARNVEGSSAVCGPIILGVCCQCDGCIHICQADRTSRDKSNGAGDNAEQAVMFFFEGTRFIGRIPSTFKTRGFYSALILKGTFVTIGCNSRAPEIIHTMHPLDESLHIFRQPVVLIQ